MANCKKESLIITNVEKFLAVVKTKVENFKQREGWEDYFILSYVSDMLIFFFGNCKDKNKILNDLELREMNNFKEQLFIDFPDNNRATFEIKKAIEFLLKQQMS